MKLQLGFILVILLLLVQPGSGCLIGPGPDIKISQIQLLENTDYLKVFISNKEDVENPETSVIYTNRHTGEIQAELSTGYETRAHFSFPEDEQLPYLLDFNYTELPDENNEYSQSMFNLSYILYAGKMNETIILQDDYIFEEERPFGYFVSESLGLAYINIPRLLRIYNTTTGELIAEQTNSPEYWMQGIVSLYDITVYQIIIADDLQALYYNGGSSCSAIIFGHYNETGIYEFHYTNNLSFYDNKTSTSLEYFSYESDERNSILHEIKFIHLDTYSIRSIEIRQSDIEALFAVDELTLDLSMLNSIVGIVVMVAILRQVSPSKRK